MSQESSDKHKRNNSYNMTCHEITASTPNQRVCTHQANQDIRILEMDSWEDDRNNWTAKLFGKNRKQAHTFNETD